MRLVLDRIIQTDEATLGRITLGGIHVCYTLEDQFQETKVPGETRIPDGEYKIILRKSSPMTARYNRRFAPWHKGMLEIAEVPDFSNILIHLGNTDDDSAGCVLVGDDWNRTQSNPMLLNSVKGYEHFYKIVQPRLVAGDVIRLVIMNDNLKPAIMEKPVGVSTSPPNQDDPKDTDPNKDQQDPNKQN